MKSQGIGAVAILALGVLALVWLYRKLTPARRSNAELLATPIYFRDPGLPKLPLRPIYIDRIKLQ
ncbi:MAG: hypothetical protein ACREQZ_15745 [Woeseiaceae bacterium]